MIEVRYRRTLKRRDKVDRLGRSTVQVCGKAVGGCELRKEWQGPCGKEARIYSSRKGVDSRRNCCGFSVAQIETCRDAWCGTVRQRNPYVGTGADCARDGANMVLG